MKTSAWVIFMSFQNGNSNVANDAYSTYELAKKELRRRIGSENIKQLDDYIFYDLVKEIKYELKLITIFEEE